MLCQFLNLPGKPLGANSCFQQLPWAPGSVQGCQALAPGAYTALCEAVSSFWQTLPASPGEVE